MYSVPESFCPQAGLALPFPIDEKEAIPIVIGSQNEPSAGRFDGPRTHFDQGCPPN